MSKKHKSKKGYKMLEADQSTEYPGLNPISARKARAKRFFNRVLSFFGIMTVRAARESQANFHAQYQRWISERFSDEIGGKMKPENELEVDAVRYSNECFDGARKHGFYNVRYEALDGEA